MQGIGLYKMQRKIEEGSDQWGRLYVCCQKRDRGCRRGIGAVDENGAKTGTEFWRFLRLTSLI